MSGDHHKITTSHLQRDAYLYVRQSTIRQVFENTESTRRQYALRERAVALGWPIERVIVIDDDLGQSAASATDREGFQKLVSEVGMGHAGIVLGLEVSRLARNSIDWHRLLEICAVTDTLILDEDGLYNPRQFNDRLLLGLKGTMSEAELHILRARLRGGIENKARRGELKIPLPVGLVYDARDRTVLDPDQQVRHAVDTFFRTFQRAGSAFATVRFFNRQELLFPRRLRGGANKGQVFWGPLTHTRALQILHNPRYAGAFAFGRTRSCPGAHRRAGSPRKLPQDQWHTLLIDYHAGYISWEQFQLNQQRLRECAAAHGRDRRKSPPREGCALLQGLVVCSICGQRMTVRYHTRQGHPVPEYVCQRDGIEHAQRICQSIPGARIDDAVGELLLEMVKPAAMEVALAVQHELHSRLDEADRMRRQRVERARYEVDLARQRYMQVDPSNRLVADALEADWNDRLRDLTEAQEQYERQRKADRATFDKETHDRIMSLADDFPRVWRDPRTPDRDRKRMVRLLIEDVTLVKGVQITVHVRCKGGATRTLRVPRTPSAWEARRTNPTVVEHLDRMLDDSSETQIAQRLNSLGLRSGTGAAFTVKIVARIRRTYGLESRYDRLRRKGMLTLSEVARQLGVSQSTVGCWRRHSLLRAHPYNAKNECLYEPLDENAPVKQQGLSLSDPRRISPGRVESNGRGAV